MFKTKCVVDTNFDTYSLYYKMVLKRFLIVIMIMVAFIMLAILTHYITTDSENTTSREYQQQILSHKVFPDCTIEPAEVYSSRIKSTVNELLAEDIDHYGIYIYDFNKDIEIGINDTNVFPPASISKIPTVLLSLIDIDNGKWDFNTPILIRDELKHSFEDSVGKIPEGDYVQLGRLIELAIIESNNTAHYHLHNALGGLDEVNRRTQNELGVETFFLNPHIATAESVGKVLRGIYSSSYLSDRLNDHLLNLLRDVVPGLREAIPAGVPQDAMTVNKVGFLYGGIEGDTYSDSAIVYGSKTDYVLVILNDESDEYPLGFKKLRDISEIVYEILNNEGVLYNVIDEKEVQNNIIDCYNSYITLFSYIDYKD